MKWRKVGSACSCVLLKMGSLELSLMEGTAIVDKKIAMAPKSGENERDEVVHFRGTSASNGKEEGRGKREEGKAEFCAMLKFKC